MKTYFLMFFYDEKWIKLTIIVLLISGIGMDSSVTPLRHGGLSLVQTTDFFYPLVDDPYMMGKNETEKSWEIHRREYKRVH